MEINYCRSYKGFCRNFVTRIFLTCSNWYTVEGHIGLGIVSHPCNLEFPRRYFEATLFIFKDLKDIVNDH